MANIRKKLTSWDISQQYFSQIKAICLQILKMDITKDFLKGIGEKITEFRELNKFTQNDLSFLTGIEKSEISRYEKGKINLTISTILKFAKALNVHPKDLFDFEFELDKEE